MKITRALLLSSKQQACAYEQWPAGSILGISLFKTPYRFLATDKRLSGKGLLFEIHCVEQEVHTGDSGIKVRRNRIVERPHIEKTFENEAELIQFLTDNGISIEDWMPIEEAHENHQQT